MDERCERKSSRILKVNRGGLRTDPKGGQHGEVYKESGRSGLQEGESLRELVMSSK